MLRDRSEKTRQSAAELIAVLLHARCQRRADGTLNALNERHFRELCSLLLWKHSESLGKYRGCQFWSQGALASRRKHGRVVTSKALYGGDALRHEHLFPRKQLTTKLFNLDDPSAENVRRLLDRLNVGVVVTLEEHLRLASEGIESDPWERYRSAGILWKDCELGFDDADSS